MNLSQLLSRYPPEKLTNWLRTLGEPFDTSPELRTEQDSLHETLSRLRARQELNFVRLATSAQVQASSSNDQIVVPYLPIAPTRAANLFLAYLVRQVQVSGLFASRPPSRATRQDSLLLELLEWLLGGRATYPRARAYWLAQNRVTVLPQYTSASRRAVGSILSLFMLGFCTQEEPTVEVSLFSSRDLARIMGSSSLFVSDEWARSAIGAGGAAIARYRSGLLLREL